jgi:dTDP-L-rhamnose 4-epimerase
MGGRRVLITGGITGGAGFIGSHLADHLLARRDTMRALDARSP